MSGKDNLITTVTIHNTQRIRICYKSALFKGSVS